MRIMLPPRASHGVVARSRSPRRRAVSSNLARASLPSQREMSHVSILPVRRALQVTAYSAHALAEPQGVLQPQAEAPPSRGFGVARGRPCRIMETTSSDVGLATERVEEHLRRHDGGLPSCARCKFFVHGDDWVRAYGQERDPRSSTLAALTWLQARPVRYGGMWALGCFFCSADCSHSSQYVPNRQKVGKRRPSPRSRTNMGPDTRWHRAFFAIVSHTSARSDSGTSIICRCVFCSRPTSPHFLSAEF